MKDLIRQRPVLALSLAVGVGAVVFALVILLAVTRLESVRAGADREPGGGSGAPSGGASSPQATPQPRDRATASPEPPSPSLPPVPAAAVCAPSVVVSTAGQLSSALADARPGQTIGLADGRYVGNFVAAASGTPDRPITLCGSSRAILDGGGIASGYVLHLNHVANWRLVGFGVTNGQKGVMVDGTTGSVIQGLTVSRIGDEGIHLRDFSTDDAVVGNAISETGLRKPKFGEGIYIGTAKSNWGRFSEGRVDNSDRILIEGNRISATTAESIDIKEGTSDGVIRRNTFDGAALRGADSWVDVKGNGWLIEGNSGSRSPKDGFQTHSVYAGWGTRNRFVGNTADVGGPGYGIDLTPALDNVVACSNTASAAGRGLTNVTCSSG